MNIYTTKPDKIINVYGYHPSNINQVDPKNEPIRFSMIPHFFYEFNGDSKVTIIYSGPDGVGTLLGVEIDYFRKNLINKINHDTKLCFENLNEGNVIPEIIKIHNIINNIIDPQQVYYFSGAFNAKEIYNNYCDDHRITNRINIYSCNSWEYYIKKIFSIKNEFNIKLKEKNYLCFNRIARDHRIALLALLNHNNLLDKGYYSFFPNNVYGNSHKNSDEVTINTLSKNDVSKEFIDLITDNYNKLKSVLPLKLNIEPRYNKNYLSESDLNYYDNSYYSLVTETFFFGRYVWDTFDEEAIFFSEKTYKPILMKHPFILLNKAHSLKALRELGYKTFSPFINESYDDETNHEKRLLMIVDEVKRLSMFTDNQWIEWQHCIKEIVEHNFNVIMNRKKHEYAKR